MTKLRAPNAGASFSYGDFSGVADESGVLDVPSEIVGIAKSHGFVPWAELAKEDVNPAEGGDEFSKMNRLEAFRWAKDHGLSVPLTSSADKAREICRVHATKLDVVKHEDDKKTEDVKPEVDGHKENVNKEFADTTSDKDPVH